MNAVQNITGTYEAQAPISHGSDEDFGMEIRLRTLEMTVRENDDLYHEAVPVVSGNSLRGQLRDLLAADLLDRLSEGVHVDAGATAERHHQDEESQHEACTVRMVEQR